jgi:uncharacterized protein (DUF983 family)
MAKKRLMEKSGLKALLGAKCPRCREGNLFKAPLIHVHKLTEMNTRCPHCQLNFNPEPYFYFGAMFISYMFSVMAMIATYIILRYFLNDPDLIYYLITAPIAIIVTFPLSFRYSRVIYFYILGGARYDSKLAVKGQ